MPSSGVSRSATWSRARSRRSPPSSPCGAPRVATRHLGRTWSAAATPRLCTGRSRRASPLGGCRASSPGSPWGAPAPQPAHEVLLAREGRQFAAEIGYDRPRRSHADAVDARQVHRRLLVQGPAGWLLAASPQGLLLGLARVRRRVLVAPLLPRLPLQPPPPDSARRPRRPAGPRRKAYAPPPGRPPGAGATTQCSQLPRLILATCGRMLSWN